MSHDKKISTKIFVLLKRRPDAFINMSFSPLNSTKLSDILERGTDFNKLTDDVAAYLKARALSVVVRKTLRAVLISAITDDLQNLIVVIKSDLKYWAHVGDLLETNFLVENSFHENFVDNDDDVDIDVIDQEKYRVLNDLIDENLGDLKIGFKITNENIIRFFLVFAGNNGLSIINVTIRKDVHVPQGLRKFVIRAGNGITRTNINANVNRPLLPPCRRQLLSKDVLYWVE